MVSFSWLGRAENEDFKLKVGDDPQMIPAFMTNYCLSNARMNLDCWWKLADLLITKYNDGYVHGEQGRPRETGYPEKWLREEIKKNPEKFTLKEKHDPGKEL